MSWVRFLILGGAGLALALAAVVLVKGLYRRVEQGMALIVSALKGDAVVSFTGALVFPILHRAEVLDISVKKLSIELVGREGLQCRDNIRADLSASFFVRVNGTREDVLKVARTVGCERASRPEIIEELFRGKVCEALRTVAKQVEFEELVAEREKFRDQVIQVIGTDLNGFALEDVAIERLDQTPIEQLDPHNILDAQGIRKLVERGEPERRIVAELTQQRRMAERRGEVAQAESSPRAPARQSDYRDARAAAEARVAALEKELVLARQLLAAFGDDSGELRPR